MAPCGGFRREARDLGRSSGRRRTPASNRRACLRRPAFDAFSTALDRDARRARARRRPRSPRLLPAAVDAFHRQPPIEPALSARALVDSLAPARARRVPATATRAISSRVPPPSAHGARDLLRALDSRDQDPRLVYFRAARSRRRCRDGAGREPATPRASTCARCGSSTEGVRGAARAGRRRRRRRALPSARPEHRHRGRGGLRRASRPRRAEVARARSRRVRRVLIVGPGLDLAPRTGLLDDGAARELSAVGGDRRAGRRSGCRALDDLEVVGADINPRVVEHLRARARTRRRRCGSVSGSGRRTRVRSCADYRDYFARSAARSRASRDGRRRTSDGHLAQDGPRRRARPRARCAPTPLDIVTERLEGAAVRSRHRDEHPAVFRRCGAGAGDGNIAAMLAPGGVLLHNEPRPALARASRPRPACRRSSRARRRSRRVAGRAAARRHDLAAPARSRGESETDTVRHDVTKITKHRVLDESSCSL